MRPFCWLAVAGLGCVLLSDGTSAQQRDFNALVRPEPRLADPDPAVRVQAVAEMSDRCETNCSATLLPLLRDRDGTVRAATVAALETLNDESQNRKVDPIAVLGLMEIANDDPSPAIRSDVIRVLGNIGDARSVPVILAALSDPASEVRVAATLALSNFDVTLDRITELSRDRDPAVAAAAIEALADVCERDSVTVLIQALENQRTAAPAIRGLGCIAGMTKDPRAIDALLDRFAQAAADEVRGLQEAAAKTGDPRAIPFIARQLTSGDSYTRGYAADALGELKHKDTVLILSHALKDPSNDVRISAAAGLAKLTDFPATPELVAALTDIDEGVRRWAPTALVRSHDPAAIDPLIRSITTNVGTVFALRELPDPRVIAALRDYLAELPADASTRPTVIETLAKLGVIAN